MLSLKLFTSIHDNQCTTSYWQQIQEKHAKRLCHKYRSVMEKIRKGGNKKKYISKIKTLHDSVADSAKGLCRQILRYKGNIPIKLYDDDIVQIY